MDSSFEGRFISRRVNTLGYRGLADGGRLHMPVVWAATVVTAGEARQSALEALPLEGDRRVSAHRTVLCGRYRRIEVPSADARKSGLMYLTHDAVGGCFILDAYAGRGLALSACYAFFRGTV